MAVSRRQPSLRTVTLVLLLVGTLAAVWGVRRLLAREADAMARVEAAERRTAAAEQAQRAAEARYRQLRDSARVQVVRSVELRDRVRVLDLSTVDIRVTPTSPPERVALPPIVVARLQQDSVTIASLTRALDASESSYAAAGGTIATLREENVALRADRPRWRFVHGVVVGLAGALGIVALAR